MPGGRRHVGGHATRQRPGAMALIDLLLNLAGLIFWNAWRGSNTESPTGGALTLVSNLRPAEVQRARRWIHLVSLAALLLIRPIFYWHLGSTLNWTASWSPGPVTLSFRSDYFGRMLLYSMLSFGWFLFVWHAWLCVLSAITPNKDTNHVTLSVREQLGWVGRWPALVQGLLPFVGLAVIWFLIVPGFVRLGIVPAPKSRQHLLQQSVVVGASLLLTFRWLFGIVFLLRLVNTYVFLGTHPIWEFVQRAGRTLLGPLNWLRIGKLDLAPLVGIALVGWGSFVGERFARQLFQALPLPWP